MNERIDELLGQIDVNVKIRGLAEQAGCSIDRLGFGEGHLEKFAELIVRECAKIADSADESPCEWIGGNILTHFGVE